MHGMIRTTSHLNLKSPEAIPESAGSSESCGRSATTFVGRTRELSHRPVMGPHPEQSAA